MHKQNTTGAGFTIVELLIIVVVIAILAAISVVAYTGIQDRANDSAVQSDLANVAKEMEIYIVSNGDLYNAAPWSSAVGGSFSKGSYQDNINNLAFCWLSNRTEYALVARSKSGKVFYVSSRSGVSLTPSSPTWTSSGGTTCPDLLPAGTYSWSWGYSPSNGWQF